MPYQALWANPERTAVCNRLYGQWTAEDYLQGAKEVFEMMRTVPHTVHAIIDLTGSTVFPTSLITQTRKIESNAPENRGMIIGVNVSRYLQAIVHIVSKIVPQMNSNVVVYVDTMEEALALVKKYELGARQQ